MSDDAPKITLPCDFLVKIIGAHSDTFESFVKESVLHHFPKTKDSDWKKQASGEARFASFTVTLYLEDETHLSELKATLAKHPEFKLML